MKTRFLACLAAVILCHAAMTMEANILFYPGRTITASGLPADIRITAQVSDPSGDTYSTGFEISWPCGGMSIMAGWMKIPAWGTCQATLLATNNRTGQTSRFSPVDFWIEPKLVATTTFSPERTVTAVTLPVTMKLTCSVNDPSGGKWSVTLDVSGPSTSKTVSSGESFKLYNFGTYSSTPKATNLSTGKTVTFGSSDFWIEQARATPSISSNLPATIETASLPAKLYLDVSASDPLGRSLSVGVTVSSKWDNGSSFGVSVPPQQTVNLPLAGTYEVSVTATPTSAPADAVTKKFDVEAKVRTTDCTISATAGTGGTISPSGTVTVAYGATKTFAVAANAGYRIDDVKVDGVSVGAVSNHTFGSVTANHSIAASFSVQYYTLAVNRIGTGTGTASPAGGNYPYGTTVTLTASADTGSSFSGWGGDLSGSANPAQVTMTGNRTVTATFNLVPPNQYALTVNNAGTGGGTVALNPAGGSYPAGTTVMLTASADAGSSFAGWGGDLSGMANPAQVSMAGNRTVVASFAKDAVNPPTPTPTLWSIVRTGEKFDGVDVGERYGFSLAKGGEYDVRIRVENGSPFDAVGYYLEGYGGECFAIALDGNGTGTATLKNLRPGQYALEAKGGKVHSMSYEVDVSDSFASYIQEERGTIAFFAQAPLKSWKYLGTPMAIDNRISSFMYGFAIYYDCTDAPNFRWCEIGANASDIAPFVCAAAGGVMGSPGGPPGMIVGGVAAYGACDLYIDLLKGSSNAVVGLYKGVSHKPGMSDAFEGAMVSFLVAIPLPNIGMTGFEDRAYRIARKRSANFFTRMARTVKTEERLAGTSTKRMLDNTQTKIVDVGKDAAEYARMEQRIIDAGGLKNLKGDDLGEAREYLADANVLWRGGKVSRKSKEVFTWKTSDGRVRLTDGKYPPTQPGDWSPLGGAGDIDRIYVTPEGKRVGALIGGKKQGGEQEVFDAYQKVKSAENYGDFLDEGPFEWVIRVDEILVRTAEQDANVFDITVGEAMAPTVQTPETEAQPTPTFEERVHAVADNLSATINYYPIYLKQDAAIYWVRSKGTYCKSPSACLSVPKDDEHPGKYRCKFRIIEVLTDSPDGIAVNDVGGYKTVQGLSFKASSAMRGKVGLPIGQTVLFLQLQCSQRGTNWTRVAVLPLVTFDGNFKDAFSAYPQE